MTLSTQDRANFAQLEDAPEDLRALVSEAATAARLVIEAAGRPVDFSDAHAALDAAVFRYLQDSAKLHSEARPAAPVKRPDSWGSVRGGHWHKTETAAPSWTRDERSLCGLTFRPLNVTHGELPPTLPRYLCAHCASLTRAA